MLLRRPWLRRRDARMLWRSATVTRSDRGGFGFLLASYLLMVLLNLFWFSKIVRKARRMMAKQKAAEKSK